MSQSLTESHFFCVLVSLLLASARADGIPNQQATNQKFLSKQGSQAVLPKDLSGLDLRGLELSVPDPSYEDTSIQRSVQHANESVMNFVEHTVRFNSTNAMAEYLHHDAGISWLTSYSDLASCASSERCAASWRTDPALGGKNVTVISVLRALDVRNVTRCHVMSHEKESYCHLPMPGMDFGRAYFALAVASNTNSDSPLPLALVCHALDDSLIQQLSAEKAAIASKYPRGIYCHPMNGNSFIATANMYDAHDSASSDLQVSAGLSPPAHIYTVKALGPPNW